MNVGELVRRSCLNHSERIAFVQGDQKLTYRKLGERINRLSNALNSMGLKKGGSPGDIL